MAEGWTHNVRCRYFMNGMCREGDACRFLHLRAQTGQGQPIPGPSSSTPIRNVTSSSGARCRYYQRGHCTYGQNCRFSHVGDLSSNSSTNSLNHVTATSSNSLQSSPINGNNVPDTSRKTSVLKKQGNSSDSGLGEDSTENWVNAPEFVPAGKDNIPTATENVPPKSYAEVCNPSAGKSDSSQPCTKSQLCPYLQVGDCKYGTECMYLHGDICDLCGQACLHPGDKEQQKKHVNECIKQHERDMELSFAVARSKDKTCGVCFEVVMEKAPREQQCRVTSDFVCPSMYWVDTKEEKEKLIKDYKGALSVKDCKYFRSGRGKCPFGNKCFYLHAFPDGTKADVGPPVRQRRHNADGEIDVLQQIILWDFLDERENRWLYSIDELEDLVAFFSDSEDSDWSDYDFFFD
ncbi:E3 ubiquitin-protein ligase makorin-1 [Blattella germanica]|nr:E3 ubiquitin-protein ligase makorin-1 [Blattella germanica]